MSNVNNTPQPLGTSDGTDNQGPQIDNVAEQYPYSVDAITPDMQYPNLPGGPDSNAPISPYDQVHYPSVRTPVDPTFGAVLGMPQYGTQLNEGSTYQQTPAE